MTLICGLSVLETLVKSMQIPRIFPVTCSRAQDIAPLRLNVAITKPVPSWRSPFPRGALSLRRRTHVEEDGEHVCADTNRVCSSDRNCAVIQGSVSDQYDYASGASKQLWGAGIFERYCR